MEINRVVKIWLIIGLIMLFFQIIIGGITRLTGSGLSITKWEIVTGTIPPLNDAEWVKEFDLYKSTPQYQKLNEGMTMKEFKFIFFWEYFHRLWARTMGFVFLLPFIFFSIKNWIPTALKRRLYVVVFLAALAASFGWIMVASGLVNRPWVNAYKLSIHLAIGIAVFSYLLWILFEVYADNYRGKISDSKFRSWIYVLITTIGIQILLGGLMSGMRAGLFYPSWPDMNGSYFPQEIFHIKNWTVENFKNYDEDLFAPALIQFLHRYVAYILVIIGLYVIVRFNKIMRSFIMLYALKIFFLLLVTQVILGIITLINCVGSIPVGLGVAHQGVGILLFGSALFLYFLVKPKSMKKIQ